MFKRILSLIICVLTLVSGFVSTGVFASANTNIADKIMEEAQTTIAKKSAEETFIPINTANKNSSVISPDTATSIYTGTCGDNLNYTLDISSGVFEITGVGDMYGYIDAFLVPWDSYRTYIKTVIIGNSVTSVGGYTFAGCPYITNVIIGDSVTSIGEAAFMLCTKLENLTIPNSVIKIGHRAFSGCYSLTNITIPSSVTLIGGYAFSNCTSLNSIVIPTGVTSIGYGAFYGCSSLVTINIPSSVTSIENLAFSRCYTLESILVDESNQYFTSLDGVLYNKNITTLIQYPIGNQRQTFSIPNSVSNINDEAFSFCYSLTSIYIPNSVTNIGKHSFHYYDFDYFEYCNHNIIVQCTETSYAYIYAVNNGFEYELIVSNITSGSCGDNLLWSLDTKTGMLTILGSGYMHNYSIGTNYAPWYDYDTKIKSVYISDSVTSIGTYAFSWYDSIINVYIGDSVTSIGNCAFSNCYSISNITIGKSINNIGESAFSDCYSITNIILPSTVESIGHYAFYNCFSLESITIGKSVKEIGESAFAGCNNLKLKCYKNSYAHTYAMNNGIDYELLICNHIFTNYEYVAATCTSDEYSIAYCDNGCGATDTIIDEGTALGHIWTDWMITIEPTYTTEGERIRYCTVCKYTEGEIIPMLEAPYDPNKPVITVDNFTVTITNADNIKDMRYARGEYTTTTEIRNAEGNVALDNGVVTANIVDGNFIYEMPNGGYYTIWIRMKDGTNYILPLPLTNINASVSTYGVKITLHDLFDVKDFYIAKGEYQTYREIKDNGYIVSVTSAKIGNKHDYTYTVYEPGVHTILVRYNDGRTVVFHEELTVTEPTFTTNGLQVTIGNITDVKVIRTAYGEYYTPGDTKRAEGARNFSNKSVIKNAEEYTIQYRNEGIVTIIVEYNNGYVKVFHYNVEMKRANCMQALSTVIFDDLDGFVMIRYAMGEYTTAAQIKRAPGSKVIKPADVTGEQAIISGLAKGTYTFCVQYDDESYNYFVVTIEG